MSYDHENNSNRDKDEDEDKDMKGKDVARFQPPGNVPGLCGGHPPPFLLLPCLADLHLSSVLCSVRDESKVSALGMTT